MTPSSVWDYLTASILAAGSIGKLLVDGGFIPYTLHDQLLAAGATFVPPANTLIFTAMLFQGAQELDIMYVAEIIKSGTILGATEQGYIGGAMFDGNRLRYKNTGAAQHALNMDGVQV